MTANHPIIVLTPATDRKDQGKTENYRVYAGGGTITVQNRRGEPVQKNTLLGGNGTIYIANELAAPHDSWVLLPKSIYDKMFTATGRIQRSPEVQNIPAPAVKKSAAKKGKK